MTNRCQPNLAAFVNLGTVQGCGVGCVGEVSEVPHLGHTVRGAEDEVRQLCPWESNSNTWQSNHTMSYRFGLRSLQGGNRGLLIYVPLVAA